jgi:signal transduction histidine kinase
MTSKRIILAAVLAIAAVCRAADIGDVATLKRAIYATERSSGTFDIEVVVSKVDDDLGGSVAVTDGDACAILADTRGAGAAMLHTGDRIRARGIVHMNDIGYNGADLKEAEILSHGEPPPPALVWPGELRSDDNLDRLVRFEGMVADVFRDDTDIRFIFFVVAGDDQEVAYVPVLAPSVEWHDLVKYIDARVSVTGLCIRDRMGSTKRKLSANLSHVSLNDIRITRPAPADPFDVPMLGGTARDTYIPVPGVSRRRKVRGRVVAVWHGDRLVVRREKEYSTVILADTSSLPSYGDVVDAVGLPETDIYHLNLSRAMWRPAEADIPDQDEPMRMTPEELLTDGHGRRQIDAKYHGRAVTVRGRVARMPSEKPGELRISIEDGGYDLTVDFSSVPEALSGITAGSVVDITGTCVAEIASWHPQGAFPSVEGCAVIVRKPSDVTVVARAPWWTVRRLFTAVGSLAVALVVILVWNIMLNRTAERRGRALLHAQLKGAKAALKAEERTRLAVELHDSLAQIVSGAAMEIAAARRMQKDAPEETARHLDIAEKTLASCRDGLRDCLWDLRSRALEETDMNSAILRTLTPHVGAKRVDVRFDAPRRRLSDNTAHAVLRIVRELTVNAIRHGGATRVKIAGAMDGDRLLFSVTDNGCGFDPDAAPGILQGHFGLAGIQERAQQLNGGMEITSAPGKGTKIRVVVSIAEKDEV